MSFLLIILYYYQCSDQLIIDVSGKAVCYGHFVFLFKHKLISHARRGDNIERIVHPPVWCKVR